MRRWAAFIYELGNGQWDIPDLRTLLEEAIPKVIAVHDFEVEHDFPTIGPQEHAAQRPSLPAGRRTPEPGPPGHRGRHRTEEVGRRPSGLRTPVPAAVPDGQGRDPHPRHRPRHDHRRQPVHVRLAGLRARRLPGQGTLGDRPVPGQGCEPGRLPGTAGEGLHPLREPAAEDQGRG